MTDGSQAEPAFANVIDTHVHVWPHGLLHPAQRTTEPLAANAGSLRRAMARERVQTALVSPAGNYLRNEYVVAAARRHPDALRSVVALRPEDGSAVPELVRRHAQGAIGVQILGRGASLRPGRAELALLVDAAAALDMFVQWSLAIGQAEVVSWAAARHAGQVNVVNHLALPGSMSGDDAARLRALASVPEAILKVSGLYALSQQEYPYEDTWSWIEQSVDAFGVDRLIWGSDWPLSLAGSSYADEIRLLDYLEFLTEQDRRVIRIETARRIFKLAP